MLFSVFKIFASNIFSFGKFLENFKNGKKGITKNILIILCFIYCVVVLGGMYIVMLTSNYKNLKALGQTELMPLISLFMSSVMIFVFGFFSASTNYYTGNGEEQFLCMPLKPVHIFGAKFSVTFITDAVLGIFIQIVAACIYGYDNHLFKYSSFYLGTIISALTVSALVIFVIYFLLIVILKLIPSLRKKTILSGVASVFLILFSLGYGLLSSRVGLSMGSGDSVMIPNPALNALSAISNKAPFILWISMALAGKWLSILAMTGIFAIIVFVLIPLVSPIYVSTLNGFSDVKTKKLENNQVENFLHKQIKSQSILKALYLRDIKTVFREPAFFSNGPLMIMIFPVIIIISVGFGLKSAGPNAISEVKNELQYIFNSAAPQDLKKIKYFIVMISAAVCIFLSNSTNIASSSFSREGKNLYNLKAMPVTNQNIILAKFLHALSYCVFSFVLIAVCIFGLIFGLELPFSGLELTGIYIGILLLEVTASMLLIVFDMFIDTVNPKLDWENPIAAFKQNLNSLFGVLTALVFIAAYIVLTIYVLPKNIYGIIIGIAFFTLVSIPVCISYWKYGIKKITIM